MIAAKWRKFPALFRKARMAISLVTARVVAARPICCQAIAPNTGAAAIHFINVRVAGQNSLEPDSRV